MLRVFLRPMCLCFAKSRGDSKFDLSPFYRQAVVIVEVINDRLVGHDGITDDIGFTAIQGSYQDLSVFLVVNLSKDD